MRGCGGCAGGLVEVGVIEVGGGLWRKQVGRGHDLSQDRGERGRGLGFRLYRGRLWSGDGGMVYDGFGASVRMNGRLKRWCHGIEAALDYGAERGDLVTHQGGIDVPGDRGGVGSRMVGQVAAWIEGGRVGEG